MATISEALAVALEEHQAGKLNVAAQIYRQILQHEPSHADALHLLGVVSHQVGDIGQADTLISRAISVNQNVAGFYNSLGNLRWDQKHFDEAITAFTTALRIDPNMVDAAINLGSVLYEAGRLEEAVTTLQAIVEKHPDWPDVLNNLGNALKDLGNTEEAIAQYEKAIALQSDYPEPLFNLANLLRDRGDRLEAEKFYRRAIDAKPQFSSAYINLGSLLNEDERYGEAVEVYRQALLTEEHLPEIYKNLGNSLSNLNRHEEAIECYQKAIRLKPDDAQGFISLGNEYFKLGKMAPSADAFKQALVLEPDYVEGYFILGNIALYQDKPEEARTHYEQALELRPDFVEALNLLSLVFNRINMAKEAVECLEKAYTLEQKSCYRVKIPMITPSVYASGEELDAWRRNFETSLESLKNLSLEIREPVREIGCTNFYYAYHGLDDRQIQEDFAKLLHAMPVYHRQTPSRNTKPRIGFISRLLRKGHTITKLMQETIARLNRDRFDVSIFLVEDPFTRANPMAVAPTDTLVWLPEADLESAATLVKEQDLDVLFYTDIGMDPTTYYLAFSRLAPVQCVFWGHPVTTGLKTIDYFIASRGMEPEDGQKHYTETLVMFDNLPTYRRPVNESTKRTRADFGLPENKHLYLCAQSLFKVHPDFDAMLGDILRQDPDGVVVFLEFKYPQLGESLKKRWAQTIPDVQDRVLFIPRVSDTDFIPLQGLVDVLLDTTHFGGGNTHYEAFSHGTPIVTMPNEHLRTRVAFAMYQQMGLMDCVAGSPQEYVEIALRLGTNPAYHAQMKARILEASQILYDNPSMVDELEAFLLQAIASAGSQSTDFHNTKEVRCV